MNPFIRSSIRGLVTALLSIVVLSSSVIAQPEIAKVITRNGRHQLLVDGKPFLILGVQSNNSSNYVSALKKVWPVVEATHANTLSIPVAWEQIEPEEGRFDFSYVDELIRQAGEHNIKLVLLWFATWKNNAPHYAPGWVKLDDKRFPRVVKRDGETLNSLSPIHRSTLEADRRAFVKLIERIKSVDREKSVIMVQVENEPGTYGEVRDFSPAAEAIFRKAVPGKLIADLGKKPGTWREVFGGDADEFFHAYHIAAYINEIAAAGKAVYPLPMNVNVALRHPFHPGSPGQYASGGPTDNVIDIWKSAAPSIDIISPDIYIKEDNAVERVLDLYARPDNPLFVAEIGNAPLFARYFYSALGHQGIGFVPFGMDRTDYANFPLGAKELNQEVIDAFAEPYELVGGWAGVWAELSFSGEVWGVSEPDEPDSQTLSAWNSDEPAIKCQKLGNHYTKKLDLGRWNAEVTFGRPMFGLDPPEGNKPASGGVLIARLGDDEYLVTGHRARVTFAGSGELEGKRTMILRVEEGHFDAAGKWVFERVWNGDQTDWGLNFTSERHILKVGMATY